jgi:hypothetical protein
MTRSRVRPALIAEAVVPEKSWPWRSHGGWLLNVAGEELRILGWDLQVRARFRSKLDGRAAHAVSPDLRYAALAEPTRVRLVDQDGRTRWEVPHDHWGPYGRGSCWISAVDPVVWASVPRADDHDEWWVLELDSGRVLARSELLAEQAGTVHFPHPDGRHVALATGEGQDGVEIYWGLWDGKGAWIRRFDSRERCLADLSPDGSRFLTTSHSGGDSRIAVHRFSDGQVLAARTPESTFESAETRFEYAAAFVRDDLIVACSFDGEESVALSADLSSSNALEYPDGTARVPIVSDGAGRWLTVDGERLELWALR